VVPESAAVLNSSCTVRGGIDFSLTSVNPYSGAGADDVAAAAPLAPISTIAAVTIGISSFAALVTPSPVPRLAEPMYNRLLNDRQASLLACIP
jgi:hypothetical protein